MVVDTICFKGKMPLREAEKIDTGQPKSFRNSTKFTVKNPHSMIHRKTSEMTKTYKNSTVESDNIDGQIFSSTPVIHHHRHNVKNRFELLKTLGQGTYGKVKLGMEYHSGEKVAIKYIRKNRIQDEIDLTRIRREIKIMATLHHQHIINVREVFENKEKIVLVMEYAKGGELYEYINVRKRLDETQARKVFRQIVSAVDYCHKNGIVHRDLKLENIVLTEDGNVKIADFGLSNYFSAGHLLSTYCGSPLYASPEIVNGTPYVGPEVDCWSLGVILYTLIYGAMPFDGSEFKILKQQITNGTVYEPRNKSAAHMLIRSLLEPNPTLRATVDNAINHWWVNVGFTNTVLGQPCNGVTRRQHIKTSASAKRHSWSDTFNVLSTFDQLSVIETSRNSDKLNRNNCNNFEKLDNRNSFYENVDYDVLSNAVLTVNDKIDNLCDTYDAAVPNNNELCDTVPDNVYQNCHKIDTTDILLDGENLDNVVSNHDRQSSCDSGSGRSETGSVGSESGSVRSAKYGSVTSSDDDKIVFDATRKPKRSILKKNSNQCSSTDSDSGCMSEDIVSIGSGLSSPKNADTAYDIQDIENALTDSVDSNHSQNKRDSADIRQIYDELMKSKRAAYENVLIESRDSPVPKAPIKGILKNRPSLDNTLVIDEKLAENSTGVWGNSVKNMENSNNNQVNSEHSTNRTENSMTDKYCPENTGTVFDDNWGDSAGYKNRNLESQSSSSSRETLDQSFERLDLLQYSTENFDNCSSESRDNDLYEVCFPSKKLEDTSPSRKMNSTNVRTTNKSLSLCSTTTKTLSANNNYEEINIWETSKRNSDIVTSRYSCNISSNSPTKHADKPTKKSFLSHIRSKLLSNSSGFSSLAGTYRQLSSSENDLSKRYSVKRDILPVTFQYDNLASDEQNFQNHRF